MSKTGWWSNAVFYQIYPRSFFDSDGDGEGDLHGITTHLSYVRDLGVDAVWMSPFYKSPNKDGGYDVSDPRDVDPRHGNLADAKALFMCAHEFNLKIIVDIIPNHFSSEHHWFKEALNALKGSPERSRFHFHDGIDEKTLLRIAVPQLGFRVGFLHPLQDLPSIIGKPGDIFGHIVSRRSLRPTAVYCRITSVPSGGWKWKSFGDKSRSDTSLSKRNSVWMPPGSLRIILRI